MGLSLGPTIANLFLAEMETRLLQQQLSYVYILDMYMTFFSIFNNEADSMEFLDRLNSQHKNL